MSLLRRLLGGYRGKTADNPDRTEAAEGSVDADQAERVHEREVLMAENDRLDDLRRRQLKYAERAWTPPKQGGERRADDEDRAGEG
jgi:hypothetical protein